jgi:glucose/arabinose dehydrogenase
MASNFIKGIFVIAVIIGASFVYFNEDRSTNDIIHENDTSFRETITQTIESSQSTSSSQTESNSNTKSSNSGDPAIDKDFVLILTEIFDASEASPVGVRNANDGSNRLFLIDQKGRILILTNNSDMFDSTVFLDISHLVDYGGEKGLLGLAFHPDYVNNGFFYVNYVSNNPSLRTVISRYTVDPSDPNIALTNSEEVVLEVLQPAHNHNGGDILFGLDGYLYIALGDGGNSFDYFNNGQNLETLLGSILRIDVDNNSIYGNYSIPANNPFKDNTDDYREEIFAYGIRNPWRMSFDQNTGLLWVGDVGQNRYEEIDIVEKGMNYGWPIMEGNHCIATVCNTTGLELPVYEYNHTLGNAITGGYVYRGAKVSKMTGQYIFADYGSGRIWSFNTSKPYESSKIQFDTDINISSFGEDEAGELYLTALSGKIFLLGQVEV